MEGKLGSNHADNSDENFEDEYEAISQICSDVESAKYDDKLILKELMGGLTREDIAKKLGHKSYKTIDMYMRRRNYSWDADKQMYSINLKKQDTIENTNSAKTTRIISLFEQGLEPMEIAKKAGFKDHRFMALYMKNKGYIWSMEINNYILKKGIKIPEEVNSNSENAECENSQAEHADAHAALHINQSDDIEQIKNLLPLLKMINKNKEKLADLLSINDNSTIPRYVIGGVTITKSLCMSHSLSELVKEFSSEKNISQREIFEVAIIEFLRKYGFENEINALFI